MQSKKASRLGEFYLFILVITLLSLLFLMISLIYSDNLSGSYLSQSSTPIGAPDLEGKEQRLPQAIIIGTRKSGTRAVAKFLEANPSIRSAHEEVHFFDRPENYQLGLDWYRKQMPFTTENQLTIEKSPAYFVTRGVPEMVKAMNASVKLIVIMRNPVTRLISDFSQLMIKPGLNKYTEQILNSTTTKRDDEQELERHVTRPDGGIDDQRRLVRTGMYTVHLERWLTVFPRQQFHFVNGERLIAEPHEELQKIELFLGFKRPLIKKEHFVFSVKKGFYCLVGQPVRSELMNLNNMSNTQSIEPKCLGSSKGRSHVAISRQLRDKLEAFYAPYNEYLFALTGLNLD